MKIPGFSAECALSVHWSDSSYPRNYISAGPEASPRFQAEVVPESLGPAFFNEHDPCFERCRVSDPANIASCWVACHSQVRQVR